MDEDEKLYDRDVDFELKAGEVAERQQKLLFELATIERLELERREASADYNAQLKEHRELVRRLRAAIESRSEQRAVKVFDRHVERTGMVQVVVASTNKVVEERAMTLEEREGPKQPELPGVGKKRGRKAAEPEMPAGADPG